MGKQLFILRTSRRPETPYWRPDAAGYTDDLREAGLYTAADAERHRSVETTPELWVDALRREWGHQDRWPHMIPGSVGVQMVTLSRSGWPSRWTEQDGS